MMYKIIKYVCLFFMILISVMAIFDHESKDIVSDTILSSYTQNLLEEKMKSKTFVYNNTYHISSNNGYPSYYENLYGNRHANYVNVKDDTFLWIFQTESADVEFIQTDPITSLIPIEVFEELINTNIVYSFMGGKWGVIIDSFFGNYEERLFTVEIIEIKNTIERKN